MSRNHIQDNHRKRYGQFFSGRKVAELLAALLPEDITIDSIIDPMAGEGDLLKAVQSKLAEGGRIVGIEIDPPVATTCAGVLPDAKIFNTDAFVCDDAVTDEGWNLVITNPPYVRYQLQDGADGVIASGEIIRKNLVERLYSLPHLPPKDRELLLKLAKGYSGLSDMAVPSWLLCASLVKMDGLLAIVVPETWLSREYAAPIQYMLAKCFDILAIVRDVNACWFDDVLVRTCLVVAKRKPVCLLNEIDYPVLCLDLESSLIDNDSLIGKMEYCGRIGFNALSVVLAEGKDVDGEGYALSSKRSSEIFLGMADIAKTAKWALLEDRNVAHYTTVIPANILSAIAKPNYTGDFITLGDLGIACGQGLRTGANGFFYLDINDEDERCFSISVKPWQGNNRDISIPKHNIIKALRNRSQVDGLTVSVDDLHSGVLYIQSEARQTDLNRCSNPGIYAVLDDAIAGYINDAERYCDEKGRTFRDYSAVKPNERKAGNAYLRFWYMLPPMAQRHLPNLCMTRVNASSAECIYIHQEPRNPIAVDANFVTLWGAESRAVAIAFALLNSVWTKCYLECVCTIMGGGALKLEAAHLRKLRFPRYSDTELDILERFGKELMRNGSMDSSLLKDIDMATLHPIADVEDAVKQLDRLLLRKLSERGAER